MFTALLDANVLVPISLADIILRSAERGLFLPRWSPAILDEALAAIRRVRPEIPPSRLQARLTSMNARFPEARVTGFESLIETIELPDINDRHVVAAARLGHADVIVTRNQKDLPAMALRRWGLEVVTPDCFLQDMLDLFPQAILDAVADQARDTRRPSLTVEQVLASLERAGAPQFAADVRERIGHGQA